MVSHTPLFTGRYVTDTTSPPPPPPHAHSPSSLPSLSRHPVNVLKVPDGS